jgi:hypothetical protein
MFRAVIAQMDLSGLAVDYSFYVGCGLCAAAVLAKHTHASFNPFIIIQSQFFVNIFLASVVKIKTMFKPYSY